MTGFTLSHSLGFTSCMQQAHSRNDRILGITESEKEIAPINLSVREGQQFVDAVLTPQAIVRQSNNIDHSESDGQYMVEYEAKFFDNFNRFKQQCVLDFQILNVPSATRMRDHTAFSMDIVARAKNQAHTDISTLGSTSVNLFYIPNDFNAQFDREVGSSSYQKIHILHAKIDAFIRQVQSKSSNCK